MEGQNLFRLNLTGEEVESALYAGLNAKEEVDKLQSTVAQNTSDINKNKFDILTKQDTLQPGINIKNINGQEITGSGEIIIDTSSKVIPSSEVQPDAQELKNLEIDGTNWTPIDTIARENIELKQDKLIAGDNVIIDNNTISVDGIFGAGDKATVSGSTVSFTQSVDSKVIVANNGEPTTDILTTLKIGNKNYKIVASGGSLQVKSDIDGNVVLDGTNINVSDNGNGDIVLS